MTRFQVRKKLLKASTGKTLTGFSLRKKLLKAGFVATFTVLGAATFSTGQAHAVVVTFDDLPGFADSIPQGYAGLNWDNFDSLNPVVFDAQSSGYGNGTVSTPNVAFNAFGDPAAISVNSGKFDFNSTYLTGAWNNGLNILVEGFLGGQSLYSKTVIVNSTSPTLLNFDFLGIDNLKFTSFGGTNAGYDGDGTHFAMDNFTYNQTKPVPEPFTILGSLTAGGIGVALRRKRQQQEKETAKV
ncbi:MAG: PEP-CTERM sorting domain-containing protein [Spirirestis rafaelensis WJT71-NPBG6]|nr:PEP-CTERM sorting domain-containing protein [Spirirestis rafaelensis WJT71-NPBG6]